MIKDYVTAKERLNFKRGRKWKCNAIAKNMIVKIQQTICTITIGLRQRTIAAKHAQKFVIQNR